MTAAFWLFKANVSDLVAYAAFAAAGWWTRGRLTRRQADA